ncbi:unnamed protein product [Cuscuta epithymum]|uniref:Alpha/beta hydrolase fold-3 domain-containing protein n=1 Tax=Cuscuta epithymum TaxID=186058 RepID=A0AAV0DK50_9ASTE|nr:unnamed protein product [Cuscuta epithymum]CAH9125403.1 unnamed protein product [Cuscuta epithymum]
MDLVFEHLPLIRVYKNGEVERLLGTETAPAGIDPHSGVSSKDIPNILPSSPEVYVRLYLPKLAAGSADKLPLLVYFHGGGFFVSSPASVYYHNYINALVSRSKVMAVSVHYRRPPEHPLPVAYHDSWAALRWVASHRACEGPEIWLNRHADFRRVFIAGDSAGANIAHNLAMMAGSDEESGLGVDIVGVALVHPFFWGSDPTGSEKDDPEKKAKLDKFWPFVCPSNPSNDHKWVNPVGEGAPSLAGLGCKRVLVGVAEKDILKDRGLLYYEALGRSGWAGTAETHESEGKDHGFHLHDMQSDEAQYLSSKLAHFFNQD